MNIVMYMINLIPMYFFGQKVESSEIKIHREVGPSTRSPTKRACVNGSRSNGAGIADKGSSRQHQ